MECVRNDFGQMALESGKSLTIMCEEWERDLESDCL